MSIASLKLEARPPRRPQPLGVRGGHRRVAGDRHERAHLALAGRLDLLGQAGHRQLAERLGSAAHAAVPAAEAHALALAGLAGRVALARGGQRERGPALAVEVAGQHVDHVDEPAGERAELLGRCSDAPVDGGAARPPPARAPCAGSPRRRSPQTSATRSGGNSRTSARTSSSPSQSSSSAPGRLETLLHQRAGDRPAAGARRRPAG